MSFIAARTTTSTFRGPASARQIFTSISRYNAAEPIPQAESSTQASQRSRAADAKARAWYLEEEEAAGEHTGTTTSSRPSGPVFTTCNPMTTMPEPASNTPLQPLPHDVPDYSKPLHTFLTSNELFVPHSISFNRTRGSKASESVAEFPNTQPERGKRRRGKSDSGEGIVVPGHETGAYWEWVVVAQVAARGKGAVSMAFSSDCPDSAHGIPPLYHTSGRTRRAKYKRMGKFDKLRYS
jgi:hypothetical protein